MPYCFLTAYAVGLSITQERLLSLRLEAYAHDRRPENDTRKLVSVSGNQITDTRNKHGSVILTADDDNYGTAISNFSPLRGLALL